MRGRIRLALGLLFVGLLVLTISSCGSSLGCGSHFERSFDQQEYATTVGVAVQLRVISKADLNETYIWKIGLGEDRGPSITEGGLFTATVPGEYTVSAYDQKGQEKARTTVRVTSAAGGTTTTADTVSDTELTTTTEATESDTELTTTTVTTASAFAGTYKGSMPLTMGSRRVDVPWGFTVDGEGNVKGGLEYSWGDQITTTFTLTGQVSVDGRLTASGTATTTAIANGKPHSGSAQALLSGKISAATFTGTLEGEGTAQVTATRQ